jgi:trehalose 6-phosphate synthase
VLHGLLGADVVGFQTGGAARNFARLCREYARAEGAEGVLEYGGRRVIARAFPISIEFEWFDERSRSEETARRVLELRSRLGEKRRMLLAIDRLDYTKGILVRLRAFEELLKQGHASVDDCVFVQIATPNRESVADYAQLRDEVERTVGRINGQFSEPGRVAVHYFRRNLTREELVAYYAAADIMLVTPLRDGMNLVAKEYAACRSDGGGVLVLSEFAGAARELTRALLVNPRDTHQYVQTLREALRMKPHEARARMAVLRNRVKRHDVHEWCADFLAALRGG